MNAHVELLHRDAMALYWQAWHIQRGEKDGTIADAIKLYRQSLDLQKKAYIKAKSKDDRKICLRYYKSIQSRIRKLTW